MHTHLTQTGTEKNDNSQHQSQMAATPNLEQAVSESLSHDEHQNSKAPDTAKLEPLVPSNSTPTVRALHQTPVTRNTAQVLHPNDDVADKNLVTPQTMEEWGPCKVWTESQWAEFKKLINTGASGEEFMKMLALNRRKDLALVFYELSMKENRLYKASWEVDTDNGEHALPDLKFSKTGLHISNTRLKRHGLEVSPNTYVKMEVIQPNKIELTVYLT